MDDHNDTEFKIGICNTIVIIVLVGLMMLPLLFRKSDKPHLGVAVEVEQEPGAPHKLEKYHND